MESFNVTCGISDLSINPGDEVGFAILNKTTGTTDPNDRPRHGQSYHTYATDLFAPFLPSVYGKYDENGRIVEIQESLTTEVLEKLFRRPAEVVLNCICSQSVYDYFGDIFANYFVPEQTWERTDLVSNDILLAHGFTKDEQVSGRYLFGDYALDIEEKSDGSPKSDGLWYIWNNLESEVIGHGDMGQFIDEIMDAFSQATGQFPGFDSNDYDVIKTLSELSVMFFLKEAYDGMKSHTMKNSFNKMNFINLEFMWDKMMKTINEGQEDGFSPEQSSVIVASMKRILGETSFPSNKVSALKVYEHNYDVFDMSILTAVMASVNKIFLPTDSDFYKAKNDALYVLDKVARKIEIRRKKEGTYE